MDGIVFSKVRKTFGSFVAVDDLDLAIGVGEFVSLLGPSGCGKTTTLRMLAGLEFPTAGTIAIGGRVVNDVAPGKRNVAMVFQSYALYPHMTVGENIAYPLRKQGVARAEREARVRTVAETLQLGALLDRRPKQLSGGQQQRVALGRALVREPAAFLLDEPLSNLDAKLRAHMRAELIELHRRVGKTFVYVTHDQLEAMTMSDRIAVMHEGALQQFAPPRVIYDQPANLMVAGFIGSPAMNVMDAELQAAPGGTVATNGLLRAPLAGAGGGAGGARAIKLGVRPEDVLLGAGPLSGRIRVVEPTGHETIVAFEAAGASFVARAAADFSAAPGDDIAFDLRPSRLHVFEAAGGRRLDLSGAGSIAAA